MCILKPYFLLFCCFYIVIPNCVLFFIWFSGTQLFAIVRMITEANFNYLNILIEGSWIYKTNVSLRNNNDNWTIFLISEIFYLGWDGFELEDVLSCSLGVIYLHQHELHNHLAQQLCTKCQLSGSLFPVVYCMSLNASTFSWCINLRCYGCGEPLVS